MEAMILKQNNFEWLYKPYLCFDNIHSQVIESDLEMLYLAQLAVWLFTAYSHRFIEKSMDRR
jgi:hypothetical protein